MKNPIISVVLSVYNAQKYLAEAIESILNQTYSNFEFIIINDGSTDKSLEIIKNYNDKRIVLISRENRGLIESLNEGISQAKGKYIARMDADDISLPKRFEEQVAFMERNLDIGICGTAVIGFGEAIEESIWKLSSSNNTIKTELLFSSCFAHPTVMIRRELIVKHNLFYNKAFIHSEDFELWTRMSEYTKFANLKMPLLKYRIVKDSVTREADKDIEQRYQTIKEIFKKYLEKLGIENSEEENRLHFNLTVNNRIEDNNIEFSKLEVYFSKILLANDRVKIFDNLELKKVLGKKWFWNVYYTKSIKAIFSKYFFYGLWSIIKK